MYIKGILKVHVCRVFDTRVGSKAGSAVTERVCCSVSDRGVGVALTWSRWVRRSHGLNTNLPSPSRLSFRHCSFSRSIFRYNPYSRPLSAGSCSPSHPQPCPCPWPDILEINRRCGLQTVENSSRSSGCLNQAKDPASWTSQREATVFWAKLTRKHILCSG